MKPELRDFRVRCIAKPSGWHSDWVTRGRVYDVYGPDHDIQIKDNEGDLMYIPPVTHSSFAKWWEIVDASSTDDYDRAMSIL